MLRRSFVLISIWISSTIFIEFILHGFYLYRITTDCVYYKPYTMKQKIIAIIASLCFAVLAFLFKDIFKDKKDEKQDDL